MKRAPFDSIDEGGATPEVALPTLPEADADQRLARNRFDLEALVAKGDYRFLAGNFRSASSFYALAARNFDPRSSAAASRATVMRDWLSERFRIHIVSGVVQAGFPVADWPARFRAGLAIMFGERQRDLVTERFPQMPRLFFYPGLPCVEFTDVSKFPWREEFESRYQDMRDEAEALLADTADFAPYVTRSSQVPQGNVYGLLENPDWSSLYLWNSGKPIPENAARCPRTFAAVDELVPQCHIGRMMPAVLFSLLKPGAHIPPHNGMLNVQNICHLPLVVPPNCRFRVGETTVNWQEGKLLAFDDTIEHEARNDSDRDRLILLFYVWNPFLSADEIAIVRAMLELIESYP
jgi:hypothetical protein